MIVITRMIAIFSSVVIMNCFDKSKEIVGMIALELLVIAIVCGCANE